MAKLTCTHYYVDAVPSTLKGPGAVTREAVGVGPLILLPGIHCLPRLPTVGPQGDSAADRQLVALLVYYLDLSCH